MQSVEKFKELYNEVFDSNDNITACGREKCKQLILCCEKIDKGTKFGDSATGFMETENIITLKKRLEGSL